MHLEHVNFTVSELDRSLAFYQKAFGFEVRWQGKVLMGDGVKPGAHVGVPGERFYLSLFEGTSHETAPYEYGPPGLNHFGIVVDDLDAAKAQASEAGGTVADGLDYEPGRRAYVRDPDGIEIELVEY